MILRQATPEDAPALCDIINPIIEAGGTTAHRRLFAPSRMIAHYIAPERAISTILAERDGIPLGFQALEWSDPFWTGDDPLPGDWAVIASFVRPGLTQSGIGTALFACTVAQARAAGVTAIDATIQRENLGGQRYYERMGFRTWRSTDETVSKRYDP